MNTTQHFPTSGLRTLHDFAWMAKRQADESGPEVVSAANEACWLLEQMTRPLRLGKVSAARLRAPSPERVKELESMPPVEAVQWMVDVLHPLAHGYADGRSTYAPGMLNDATRALRAAGFSLARTETLGKSVWFTDGMGDAFLSLTPAEVAERNRHRAS